MTDDLQSMLEELKKLDEETYKMINWSSELMHGFNIISNPNRRIKEHVIQGEIQRAIEKRGWEGIILWYKGSSRAVVSEFSGGFGATEKLSEQIGQSPAAALLAAYLQALRYLDK